eukprot:SAG22_NODE_5371_length_1026_cov_2.008630_3_plen_86_part_01
MLFAPYLNGRRVFACRATHHTEQTLNQEVRRGAEQAEVETLAATEQLVAATERRMAEERAQATAAHAELQALRAEMQGRLDPEAGA